MTYLLLNLPFLALTAVVVLLTASRPETRTMTLLGVPSTSQVPYTNPSAPSSSTTVTSTGRPPSFADTIRHDSGRTPTVMWVCWGPILLDAVGSTGTR